MEKIYSIKDMRKKVANNFSVSRRNDIVDFISIKSFYKEVGIEHFFIDLETENKDCYISLVDFNKLCSYLNATFGCNYHEASIPFKEVESVAYQTVTSVQHAEYFDGQLQYIFTLNNHRNHFFDSFFIKELKMDKTMTAFDFSYDKNMNIVDVGISYFDNKIQKNYHFIVEEYMPTEFSDNTRYFSFNFGKTEVKKLSSVIDFISLFANQADLILLHDATNDMIVVEKLGLSALFESKKMIDTSLLLSGSTERPEHERISLKNLLTKSKISYSQLHNSGNDAFYTLKAFLKNFKKSHNKF
jgi:hypothetical protein